MKERSIAEQRKILPFLLLLVFLSACISSQPSPTPHVPPPTLPPTWTPEPSATPGLGYCQMTALTDVIAYQRPSLEAEPFAELTNGAEQVISARTSDGWLGFDPGVAQAANVGPFRLRWVQENANVELNGDCAELPVLEGPAPGACYTMAMEEIPLFIVPSSASRQVAAMQAKDYARVLRKTIDNWLLVQVASESALQGEFGWMDGKLANFNGPCTDLVRKPYSDYPVRRLGPDWEFEITRVEMISAKAGWAVARSFVSEDHILHTSDGGATWQDVTPPEPRIVLADARKSATAAFIDADVAHIVYINSGPPTHSPQLSFWSTRDGGETWTAGGRTGPLSPDEAPELLDFIDPEHGWLMGNIFIGMGHHALLLLRTTDGGASYQRLQTPPESETMCRATGLAFADAQNGWMTKECTFESGTAQIEATQDGGATWQEVSLGAPTQDPDFFQSALFCTTHAPALFTPAQGKLIVSCTQEGEGERFIESYLYSTSDGGGTWLTDPLPSSSTDASSEEGLPQIFFLDPQHGWLLGREIFITSDGGESWTRIKVVRWDGQFSFVDALNGWAVARSGEALALVRTYDGGRSWQELEPTLAAEPPDEVCMVSATDVVLAYNRPSLDAEVFAEMGGLSLNVTARTADGWIGFDPGYAQAGNIGVFHNRWIPPESSITLEGDCDDIPVVSAPAPGVCFTMVGFPVQVYSAPDIESPEIVTLDYAEYTKLVGESADGMWMMVDLSVGTVGLEAEGWIHSSNVQFNGPCYELPTVNP